MAISGLLACMPDLVLVDLGLPDLPGLKVIEQTKAIRSECDVVVITTFGDEQSVFSALEAGANGYLLKGGTEEELRRDINFLREGGSPLSPAVLSSALTFTTRQLRRLVHLQLSADWPSEPNLDP
jgi:DNA-binding NarL/FixJ family response regulator